MQREKKQDHIECQKGCKTTLTLLYFATFTSHSAGGNI